MYEKIHNTIFYCIVALISILLFYWLKNADDSIVRILLIPHARLAEIYYNTSLVYINGIGYSSIGGTFSIGRECMGSNFIIMMFGMTSYIFVKHFSGAKKMLWLVTSLVLSIAIGILVSCIRIIGSVPFVTYSRFALLHSGIGISLYLITLTGSYAILKKLFRSEKNEENI
jgi:exosortase K